MNTEKVSILMIEDNKADSFFEERIKTGKPGQLEHRIVINNRIIKYLTIWARVNFDENAGRLMLIGGIQDISDRRPGK